MKTIRGKLLTYFFIFLILFQVTAISIFISSNEITSKYDDSFQRFLLLNSISQKAEELYTLTNQFVISSEVENTDDYFHKKRELTAEKEKMSYMFPDVEQVNINSYINLIETFIHESELTVGFVLKQDIEQYTDHLEETRISSGYIQEAALELIDTELTVYQSFYKDLQQRNEYFLIFIILLFMTTIILAIFFAFWFSNGMTHPLRELSHAAQEISDGNLLGKQIHIHSNDELKLLGNAFNQMRSNIHELVKEIKDQSELDQLLKEMELKHLQNQINPHFLFNTLNTVSKMAYLEDAHVTSGLIVSVSSLMRHNLGELDKHVTLKDEVEVVEDYFSIQKTRFSERIQFITNIDETCLDIEIPRLTLQPLIENAFIHGIEQKENGGTITLHVKREEPCVIVEVSDDGEGIKQEKIEALMALSLEREHHVGHSTGIGLTNVMRRLQLFYQKDHIMEIESEIGKWTTIRLILPRNVKGAK